MQKPIAPNVQNLPGTQMVVLVETLIHNASVSVSDIPISDQYPEGGKALRFLTANALCYTIPIDKAGADMLAKALSSSKIAVATSPLPHNQK